LDALARSYIRPTFQANPLDPGARSYIRPTFRGNHLGPMRVAVALLLPLPKSTAVVVDVRIVHGMAAIGFGYRSCSNPRCNEWIPIAGASA
jgi:hypothetical protein